MRLSIAVIAMSNLPSMRWVSWNTELGVGVSFASRPFSANKPFSCATQMGQLKPPGKTITLTVGAASVPAQDASSASAAATKQRNLRMVFDGRFSDLATGGPALAREMAHAAVFSGAFLLPS